MLQLNLKLPTNSTRVRDRQTEPHHLIDLAKPSNRVTKDHERLPLMNSHNPSNPRLYHVLAHIPSFSAGVKKASLAWVA